MLAIRLDGPSLSKRSLDDVVARFNRSRPHWRMVELPLLWHIFLRLQSPKPGHPIFNFASTAESAKAEEPTQLNQPQIQLKRSTTKANHPGYCDGGNYYYRSSVCDELKCCMTSKLKSMAAQGITYGFGATQFYQGVTSGGQERNLNTAARSTSSSFSTATSSACGTA